MQIQFRVLLKAHIKAHYRTVGGKVIYVSDHDDKRPHGQAAALHERTAMGRHADGSTYLRATDAEDAKHIQSAAEQHGISLEKRRRGATHHGRVGAYDHFHVQDPAHAATIMGELGAKSHAEENHADSQGASEGAFHHRGDKARYTGTTQEQHGGKFHEVEYLEGHRKGEKEWTMRGPEHASVAEARGNAPKPSNHIDADPAEEGKGGTSEQDPYDTPEVRNAKAKTWEGRIPHGDMRGLLGKGQTRKGSDWDEVVEDSTPVQGTDDEIGALKHLHATHGVHPMSANPCHDVKGHKSAAKDGKPPMEFIGKDQEGRHHYINTEGHAYARYARHIPDEVMSKVINKTGSPGDATEELRSKMMEDPEYAEGMKHSDRTAKKAASEKALAKQVEDSQSPASVGSKAGDEGGKEKHTPESIVRLKDHEDFTGFGYFGHQLHHPSHDAAVAEAANHHGLYKHQVTAFLHGRSGRWAMDDLSFKIPKEKSHAISQMAGDEESSEAYRQAAAALPFEKKVEHFKEWMDPKGKNWSYFRVNDYASSLRDRAAGGREVRKALPGPKNPGQAKARVHHAAVALNAARLEPRNVTKAFGPIGDLEEGERLREACRAATTAGCSAETIRQTIQTALGGRADHPLLKALMEPGWLDGPATERKA